MPEHLATGVNSIKGSISLVNSKTATFYFIDESNGQQRSFTIRPNVSFTVSDTTTVPAARVEYVKSGSLFVGAKVKFTLPVTLDVEWMVTA